MGFLASINRYIGLMIDAIKQVARGRVWLILGAYLVVQWLLLYSHYQFTSPLFHSFIDFWTRLWNESMASAFSHYPGHFLFLPYFFGWAKFLLGILVEGLVLGLVARQFWLAMAGDREGGLKLPRMSLFMWLQLMGGWLLINGLILAIGNYLPGQIIPLLDDSPRRILAFELVVLPFIDMILFAFLFYLIPAIAVFGDNLFKALGRSVRMFLSSPFLTILLAGTVLVGPVLISFASGRSNEIIEKFHPELVYWLLFVGLIVDLLANFLWMSSSVRQLSDD